jgi:hypothetical protein
MMDPIAIVIVAIIIVAAVGGLVFSMIAGDLKPSTKPPSASKYDAVWEVLDAAGGIQQKKLNMIAAPRGHGKSFVVAYRQGYQKGYQEGIDHAIDELCGVDGK